MSKIFVFGFLVITHTDYLGFGPDLVGIFPRSLPQLSKQLRDQNNNQKPKKNKGKQGKPKIARVPWARVV